MSGYMIAGIIVVLTVFVTLSRIAPLKRWLGYATILDVTFTVMMIWLFHDTYSGVVAAAFAGLTMAVVLTTLRKAIGFERLAVKRVKISEGGWRLYWKAYPATLVHKPSWFRRMKPT